MNSTSTVPTLNHVITVQEGTTNKIVGSSRGKINGSIKGAGNLTIQTKYVRCDVGATFAQFEGQLTAQGDGGNFRLMQNVTDMSKARLVIAAGTTVSHVASGGSSEVAATLKVGALSSTATDAVLGGSQSNYQVGFLNSDTRFLGLLKCARLTKVGTGKLTLTAAGHTAPITVSDGTLELSNSGTTVVSTGAITVTGSGILQGNALLSTATVANGGTVTAGLNGNVGTLRVNGALRLNSGAIMLCKLNQTANDKFTVKGAITHNADTLLIRVPAGRKLNVGDELAIFTTGFTSATGEPIVKCEAESFTCEFDTSTLNTDGKIRVTKIIVTSKPGDVNGDGIVDIADIAAIISVMASSAESQSGTAPNPVPNAADVNGDGIVDVADISSVIAIMAANSRMANN